MLPNLSRSETKRAHELAHDARLHDGIGRWCMMAKVVDVEELLYVWLLYVIVAAVGVWLT